MSSEKIRVTSGVDQLDRLLGGVFIGDNVVWYDDAGSLASVFCLNFIQASQAQKKSLIYVSFDRSPRNLLEKLGPLAENRFLTILDCFTYGKGEGSDVFLKFYEKTEPGRLCRIISIDDPRDADQVMDVLYGVHKTLKDDVRFVFESLTGMQDLWGGEDHIRKFYSHSCPRLYELNTIAYWIIEKRAHSNRLKAGINQIAQVVIDLSIKRGKMFLSILKAEKHNSQALNKPYPYWNKDLEVTFNSEKCTTSRIDLGIRLKELRTQKGLSQTELAKLVGVTPSTISQVESNLIYPSLPALFKMAEILCVELSSFFRDSADVKNQVVFRPSEAMEVQFPDPLKKNISARLVTPLDFKPKAETYIVEIPPLKTISSHFFIHKGEELGYVLSGELQMKMKDVAYSVQTGDLVYLTSEMPQQWKNPGPDWVRLLWIKVK